MVEGPGGVLKWRWGIAFWRQAQTEMRIEKSSLLLLKGSWESPASPPHSTIAAPIISIWGTDEATGQLLDSSQASGGRREKKEDGKEGTPGRKARLVVMGWKRMHSCFSPYQRRGP